MAVTMVATIKRFIGLSTDIKPIDDVLGDRVYEGSTFLESDTGNMYIYKGGDWLLKEEANIALRLEVKNLMSELLEETKKTNGHLEVLVDKC
jgi:hypothetical protein